MLVVEELYNEAVVNTDRKLIIFNGELDRIRSGCILCLVIVINGGLHSQSVIWIEFTLTQSYGLKFQNDPPIIPVLTKSILGFHPFERSY